MSPRRIFAALAVLALAVLTVTAGAAFASEFTGVSDGHEHGWHGKDTEPARTAATAPPAAATRTVDQEKSTAPAQGPARARVRARVQESSGGEVTGSGAGTPSVPVEAPAVAASGPAPDAATAAPASGPVTDAFVAAGDTTDAPGAVVPAPTPHPSPHRPFRRRTSPGSTASRCSVRSATSPTRCTDGPSAARALAVHRDRPLARGDPLAARRDLRVPRRAPPDRPR